MTSKTKWESRDKDKQKTRVKRVVHPKKYTDPITDINLFIDEEMHCIVCGTRLGTQGWCRTCLTTDD